MPQTRIEKFVQRTASHMRWLLNERAMLVGEIERRQERIDRLAAEQRALQEKIDALDVTIARCDERINAAAAGTVRATTHHYSGWGSLKAFLKACILAAGDAGVDTTTLCHRTIAHFNLQQVVTPAEIVVYRRNSLHSALRQLREEGTIEPIPRRQGSADPAVWRPKRPVTLADLAELTGRSEAPELGAGLDPEATLPRG